MTDGGAGWVSLPGSGVSLRVDRDTVMRAIRIVVDEAQQYRDRLPGYKAGLLVTAPGGDPVSQAAQGAWNGRLRREMNACYYRCLDYAEGLEELAERLGEAARSYGYTEEEVAALFPPAARDRIDGDDYVV